MQQRQLEEKRQHTWGVFWVVEDLILRYVTSIQTADGTHSVQNGDVGEPWIGGKKVERSQERGSMEQPSRMHMTSKKGLDAGGH